jgi:class I fructose-bisphosphate aldolase
MSKIEKDGKVFLLAYDQGLEHGPTDFNDKNYHPNFIFKTAIQGNATCVAMHYGLAKRFYTNDMKKKMPLILKINGKSGLYSGNDRPAMTGSVEDAKRLGAVGVGMTIYPGKPDEHIEYERVAEVRREAEKAGLLLLIWAYGRGPEIENQFDTDVVAYSARVAAELGADYIKTKYTGDPESYSWAVKNAAGAKLLVSGTDNFPEDYVQGVGEMMKSGAAGIAVGRKVWQDEDPIAMARKVAQKVYAG